MFPYGHTNAVLPAGVCDSVNAIQKPNGFSNTAVTDSVKFLPPKVTDVSIGIDEGSNPVEHCQSYILKIGDRSASETTQLLSNTLLQFDAEMELIPLSSRHAYTEAMYTCPDLIRTETCPIHWILYEQFNVRNAAIRLARYWEWRKRIYGPDRAFLPLLDLSGCGALQVETIERMKLGAFVPLPYRSAGSTKSGYNAEVITNAKGNRHVFFADRSRMRDGIELPTLEMYLKVPFYFLTHVLSKDNFNASTDSVLLIDLLASIPRKRVGMTIYKMTTEGFPFQLEPSILSVPYSKKRTYFQQMLPIIMKRMGKYFHSKIYTVHIGESKLDLQRQLEANNLSRDCLPPSVGGTWSYDQYNKWFVEELRKQSNNNNSFPVYTSLDHQVMSEPRQPNSNRLQSGCVEQLSKDSENSGAVSYVNGGLEECLPIQNRLRFMKLSEGVPYNTSSSSDPKHVKTAPVFNNAIVKIDVVHSGDDTKPLEAAMESIPWLQKGVYMEALERCPELIRDESCPLLFLHANNNDSVLAANKLASYWHQRKELFGPEIAFHPTCNWTVSTSDINFCHERCSVIPNDSMGRSVLYYEPLSSYSSVDKQKETEERTLFFNLTKLLFNQTATAVNRGIVLVIVLLENDEVQLNSTLFSESRFMFPIHFTSIHIIVKSSLSSNSDTSDTCCISGDPVKIQSRLLSTILGRSGNIVQFHSFGHSHTHSDVVQALIPHGFCRENLPVAIGGTWTNGTHVDGVMTVPHSIATSCAYSHVTNNDETTSGTKRLLHQKNETKKRRHAMDEEVQSAEKSDEFKCVVGKVNSSRGKRRNKFQNVQEPADQFELKQSFTDAKKMCRDAYLRYITKLGQQKET